MHKDLWFGWSFIPPESSFVLNQNHGDETEGAPISASPTPARAAGARTPSNNRGVEELYRCVHMSAKKRANDARKSDRPVIARSPGLSFSQQPLRRLERWHGALEARLDVRTCVGVANFNKDFDEKLSAMKLQLSQ